MPIHSTPPSDSHRDAAATPANDDVEGGSAAPGPGATVVDPAVLRAMEDDFADKAVVARFARDFCESLGGKLDRIERALGVKDAAGSADAIQSVTTSSMMVGAVQLTRMAVEVQDLMARGAMDSALLLMAKIRTSAADTITQLQAIYPGGSSGRSSGGCRYAP
ncbi:Hpt domain-containing protein [Arthrobacter echini]|uniref:Hpt domain-containing protein n=1 Tax=Arthrobacter echini TaxID=1529066 RepID=A0A4S5E9U3_9MICC|nr:Hpt domain-containing protein [Arthrobacter echini]THJ68475.1 Hpt domain-containing protein [Arthrobacter echini]